MRRDRLEIALIGPYPPPYGGVSIYIQRLEMHLRERGIKCIVYDTTGGLEKGNKSASIKTAEKDLFAFIFTKKENIIHLQFSRYDLKTLIKAFLFVLTGKKTIITYHSWRKEIPSINLVEKFIIRVTSLFISQSIVVNSHIKENLVRLGFNQRKIEIIPSFISPIVKEEEVNEIPRSAWDFISIHKPIISANASKIVFYNGEDLYGIDMCIDLCANLKNNYPQIGFVFCLPEVGNYEYLEQMKHRIKEKGIENNFLFQTKPCQMYPIIMKSDIFARPTNTDGDAVSLREALCFKIPSIASDVVSRPEGVIIFRSRDINDLTSKVKDVLDNYDWYKKKNINIEFDNNAEKIVKIYQKLGTKEGV